MTGLPFVLIFIASRSPLPIVTKSCQKWSLQSHQNWHLTVDTIRQLNDDIYDWTSFRIDIYSIKINTTNSNQELQKMVPPLHPKLAPDRRYHIDIHSRVTISFQIQALRSLWGLNKATWKKPIEFYGGGKPRMKKRRKKTTNKYIDDSLFLTFVRSNKYK